MRPQVVFFGEMLDHDKVRRLNQEVRHGFDLVFTVGTTSVFPYVSWPVIDANQRGAPIVEINPAGTSVSDLADIRIPGKAAAVLDEIWKAFPH